MLKRSRANINAKDSNFGNVLAVASLGRHIVAVQILIDHGTNINASSGRLGSILQAAYLGGHIDLVKYLLDKQANVNASRGRFGNALQAVSFSTRNTLTQTNIVTDSKKYAIRGYTGLSVEV